MIKSSAVLAIALALIFLMRRRSAAERHSILAAGIIAAAFLPMLALFLPSWEPQLAARIAAALPQAQASLANPDSGSGDVIFRAIGLEPSGFPITAWWPALWLAGSGVFFLLFAIGIVRQLGSSLRSPKIAELALQKATADVALQIGCKQTIDVRQGGEHTMPVTWGIFRPKVFLPNSAFEWRHERLRVVLAHELAHVRRRDWLFQILAQSACAVYWFNPLFWIASSRLYRAAEEACDDAVINLGVDARDYAVHLLEIARELKHPGRGWSPTLAMARPSTVEQRFRALLNPGQNRSEAAGKAIVAIVAGMIAIALPMAAFKLPASGATVAAAARVDQYTTPPLYSDEARARGIEGVVVVEVRIGKEGHAEGLRVAKGLGYGLDENALLAVREWRFTPARINGLATASSIEVGVEFRLRNAELNELIANDMATRVGPGVTPPQVVHSVIAEYPEGTPRSEGTVVLDAVIQEDGIPKIVRVIRSLDWELDEIAIKALEQWRFSPAIKDGSAVKVRMNVAVNFD